MCATTHNKLRAFVHSRELLTHLSYKTIWLQSIMHCSTCATFLHTVITLLENNPFLTVLAIDFSKLLTVCSTVPSLSKFSYLDLPDHIYNWIESFFHCTRHVSQKSELRTIIASVIQGSAIGPALYVVAASYLYSITPGNFISKYADDTYVIIPATNVKSCSAEISNIETWAGNNNLRLNTSKSLSEWVSE